MIDLKSMIKGCLAVSFAALAVFALFSRSFAFSYIGIDDAAYTFRNPFVASGFSIENVVEAFANFRHGGIWMPITYISYMIDFSICKTLGIPLMQMLHLGNVLLHVINFCLLIRFLRGLCVPDSVRPFTATAVGASGGWGHPPSRATHEGVDDDATQDFGRATLGRAVVPNRRAGRDNDGDAQMTKSTNGQMQSEIANRKIVNHKFLLLIILAALVWAIHPLRVEPVAWVAARKELLWTMFTLLGLLSWMKFCGSWRQALGQPSMANAATTGWTPGGCGQPPSQATHEGVGDDATQGFGRATLGRAVVPNRRAGRDNDGDAQMTKSTNGPMQSKIVNRKIVNHKYLACLTVLFCILACLSKPTAMCFPFLALLVNWIENRRRPCALTSGHSSVTVGRAFGGCGQPPSPTYEGDDTQGFDRAGFARAAGVGLPERSEPAGAARGRARPSRATHDDAQMAKSTNGQIQSKIANRKIANPPTQITVYILMFMVAGATAAIAAYSQTHVAGQDVTSLYATPLPQRLVNALSAIGYYLRATIWPFGLHIDCRTIKSLMPLEGWLNLSVLAVTSVVCLWLVLRAWRNAASKCMEGRLSSTVTTTGASSLRQTITGGTQFIASAIVCRWRRLRQARPSRVEPGGWGQPPSRATHDDAQMAKSTNGQMQSKIVNRKIANPPMQSKIVNRKIANPTDTLIFSLLWFVVGLLPTLGIFGGFGIEAHADRFAYLPSMAISFLCAALLVHACGLGRLADAGCPLRNGVVLKWALSAVVLALAVVTFRQLGFWRDDAAAYWRVLSCDPAHPRAMVHVADSLCSRRRDFAGGIAMYRKALALADTVPYGGFNVADVRARLAYALASRGGYDDFDEVKRLGADVLKDVRLDRRGMMLDALGTAFMHEGDYRLAAVLFAASLKAPDRFWPKASTQRKLDMCKGGF